MKNTFNRFLCFVVIFGIFALCGTFTSCENLFGGKAPINYEKAYITITTNLSTNARTVLPSNSFTTDTTGLTWTLTGSLNGGAVQELGKWSDTIGVTEADTTTAYDKMISGTSITLNAGTWTFTLTASNESGKLLLEATIEQKINGGENTLSFVMEEATGDDAASGQIEFTLTFPGNVIKNVNATLTKRGETNFLVEQTFTADPTETFLSEVNFSYHGNDNEALSAGNYILKLELQQQTGTTEATENTPAEPNYETINTYTCLIHVAPGLCSKGEAELDTLARLYVVTFEEGIEFEESIVPTSYNAYTTFALPTIEEDGYEYQWYKNCYDFYANSYYQESIDDPSNVSITEDTTFGVKCYKIVAEDDIVRTAKGDSTGDYFSIGTAEGLAIFRALVNGSHENLKMVDKSGESEDGYVYYDYSLVSQSQLNAKLTSDIDLTHDADGNELSWVPINGYSGTFDGGGHTITVNNTYYSKDGVYYQGLFDTLDGATIKNLVVAGEETISESGLDYCGGIASQIKNQRSVNTTFENCVNKRNITVSADVEKLGGFAGDTYSKNSETTNFVNCINLGTIENNYNASEDYDPYVAGFTTGATSYEMCINAGNVTGATFADDEATISGTVAGFDASVSAKFENCINLGDISANSYTADDVGTYSTEKVYGFSSIDQYNYPTFTYCIDAGSAKNKMGIGYPFTGVVGDTTGTYVTSYYNSDSYGSDYNTDYAKTSDKLCQLTTDDLPTWNIATSRYPLPDIEENFSNEIWQEVEAKAIPKVSNFEILQERIASANGTAENPEVIVLNGDIDIAETLEITTPIKIIASTSAGVTITRGPDDSGSAFTGAFFDNQSTLTLEGITLDGGKNSQIEATAPLITSSGSLTLNNCTLQNNRNTSNTPGGAINISAGTFIMNGGVIGSEVTENDLLKTYSWEYAADASSYSNYAYAGGGGIYVASGDVTINNAKISHNYTLDEDSNNIAHGGGIYIASGNLTLEDTEVSYNRGYQGAGVKCYSDNAGTVTLKHATIKGNAGNVPSWHNFGGGVVIKNFTLNCDTSTEASIIEENYSGDGGALFLENTTSTLQNITIQNNSYNENGYKNGSEVLLYSGANVSIGSNDVTIASAEGETRGIFMNYDVDKPNTLNLFGDAKLDAPIYLTNGAMITISAALTSTDTVATITPEYYPGDTYVSNNDFITVGDVSVLTVGTGVTLSNDIVGRFAVTPKINDEDNSETEYAIDSSGMLQLDE